MPISTAPTPLLQIVESLLEGFVTEQTAKTPIRMATASRVSHLHPPSPTCRLLHRGEHALVPDTVLEGVGTLLAATACSRSYTV